MVTKAIEALVNNGLKLCVTNKEFRSTQMPVSLIGQ